MAVPMVNPGSGGEAGIGAGKPPPGVDLPREKQVKYVTTLLDRQGEKAAVEIRRRISFNQGVTVKGLTFDSSVLQEALGKWTEEHSKIDATSVTADAIDRLTGSFPPSLSAAGAAATAPNRTTSGTSNGIEGHSNRKTALGRGKLGAGGAGEEKAVPRATPGGSARQLKRKVSEAASGEDESLFAGARARAMSPVRGPSGRSSLPTAKGARRISGGASAGKAAGEVEADTLNGPTTSVPTPGHTWELSFSPKKRRGTQAAADLQEEKDPRRLGASAFMSAKDAAAAAAPRPSAAPRPYAGRGRPEARPATPSAAWSSAPSPPAQPATSSTKKPEAESPAAEAAAGASAARTDYSVKELKTLLSDHGIDFSSAVEKSDLQALWQRFSSLKDRPLSELQAACRAQGGPRLQSKEACARYLAAPPSTRAAANDAGPVHAAPAAPAASPFAATAPAESDYAQSAIQREQAARREDAAQAEVERILRLKSSQYWGQAAWGFAVLGVEGERSKASVARGYRGMMKVLHPDKVGQSQQVTKALELVKEAKDVCERSLSSLEAPAPPRNLKSTCVDASKGRRKFRLTWQPPASASSERAPVRRYVVAAFDPAYGRALTVTNLEPDYSEELKRFVPVEELNSYLLAEEELQKMPQLWQQPFATVQVASANEAGQSAWATLQVPLLAATATFDFGGSTTATSTPTGARRLGTRKRASA